MRVRVEVLGRGKMRAQRRGSMTQIREKPGRAKQEGLERAE